MTWSDLGRIGRQRATLQIDGKVLADQLICAVAAANGQFFGGGMRIAPHARLDDRLLDVVIIGPVSLLDFIRWGPRFYQGRYLCHPRIQYWYWQARTIRAQSQVPIAVEVDGETVGTLPASFTVMPRAVRILGPG